MQKRFIEVSKFTEREHFKWRSLANRSGMTHMATLPATLLLTSGHRAKTAFFLFLQ
jgi:hypothetical protein